MSIRKGSSKKKFSGAKRTPKSRAGLFKKDDPKFAKVQFELGKIDDFGAWHARHFIITGISAGNFFLGSTIEYLRRRWLAKRAGYVDKNGEVSVIAWEDGLKSDKKAEGSLIAKLPYTDAVLDMVKPNLKDHNKKRLAKMKKQKSSSVAPAKNELINDFLKSRK